MATGELEIPSVSTRRNPSDVLPTSLPSTPRSPGLSTRAGAPSLSQTPSQASEPGLRTPTMWIAPSRLTCPRRTFRGLRAPSPPHTHLPREGMPNSGPRRPTVSSAGTHPPPTIPFATSNLPHHHHHPPAPRPAPPALQRPEKARATHRPPLPPRRLLSGLQAGAPPKATQGGPGPRPAAVASPQPSPMALDRRRRLRVARAQGAAAAATAARCGWGEGREAPRRGPGRAPR